MRAYPSAHRYFSIQPSQFVAVTRDWRLNASEPLRMRNPDHGDEASDLLTILRPGRDVTVYSLPMNVERTLGEKAVMKALNVLAQWKREPVDDVDGRSRLIAVYLYRGDQLRVIKEAVKFRRGKFGAGEGLASSRKLRVTSRQLTVVATLPLD